VKLPSADDTEGATPCGKYAIAKKHKIAQISIALVNLGYFINGFRCVKIRAQSVPVIM
jgi:hypothetical protein